MPRTLTDLHQIVGLHCSLLCLTVLCIFWCCHVENMLDDMSMTEIRNKIGPRIVPWGPLTLHKTNMSWCLAQQRVVCGQ